MTFDVLGRFSFLALFLSIVESTIKDKTTQANNRINCSTFIMNIEGFNIFSCEENARKFLSFGLLELVLSCLLLQSCAWLHSLHLLFLEIRKKGSMDSVEGHKGTKSK